MESQIDSLPGKPPRILATEGQAPAAGMPRQSRSQVHQGKLHFLNLDGTRLTGSKLSALKEMPLSQLQMTNTDLTGENWNYIQTVQRPEQ